MTQPPTASSRSSSPGPHGGPSLSAPDAAVAAPSPRGAARRVEVAAQFRRFGPGYRWWAVISVLVGTTAAVMEGTIVNVALPRIAEAFTLSQDQLQLLSAGFLASTTATMVLSHWAIERFGIRRLYVGGMLALIVFSLLAVVAPNFTVLALCRIVQGVIAGLTQPLAMVVIADVFPLQSRGRAMSAYGFGVVLSPILGPLCGGLLVDSFGWRAVFLVTVPLCATGAWLAQRYLIRGLPPPDAPRPRLDLIGLLLVIAAIVCLLGGLTLALRAPGLAMAILGAGLATAVAFVLWERRVAEPLLDFGIFRHPGFTAAVLVSVIYGMGIYSTAYLVPQFAQIAIGLSAFQASATFLPGGILMAMTVLVSGRLADLFPANRVAMAGLACFAVSSLLLGLTSKDQGFWQLAIWVGIGQIGLALIIPSLNSGALSLLPPGTESAGAAAISFFRQVGGTFGVATLALFIESRHRFGEVAPLVSLQQGFFLVAAFYAAAQIPGWRMQPRQAR